jgi:hypothetical protein
MLSTVAWWRALGLERSAGVSVTMLDLLKDLWGFASERKKFWLVPLIGTLLVLSALIAIAEFSTVAPFIYTLF